MLIKVLIPFNYRLFTNTETGWLQRALLTLKAADAFGNERTELLWGQETGAALVHSIARGLPFPVPQWAPTARAAPPPSSPPLPDSTWAVPYLKSECIRFLAENQLSTISYLKKKKNQKAIRQDILGCRCTPGRGGGAGVRCGEPGSLAETRAGACCAPGSCEDPGHPGRPGSFLRRQCAHSDPPLVSLALLPEWLHAPHPPILEEEGRETGPCRGLRHTSSTQL